MTSATESNKPKTVAFTIDGRTFTTQDRRQPARDLLRVAGLDPTGYDLAEIRPGGGKPRQYDADEPVQIRDGARFVSVRQRAEVA